MNRFRPLISIALLAVLPGCAKAQIYTAVPMETSFSSLPSRTENGYGYRLQNGAILWDPQTPRSESVHGSDPFSISDWGVLIAHPLSNRGGLWGDFCFDRADSWQHQCKTMIPGTSYLSARSNSQWQVLTLDFPIAEVMPEETEYGLSFEIQGTASMPLWSTDGGTPFLSIPFINITASCGTADEARTTRLPQLSSNVWASSSQAIPTGNMKYQMALNGNPKQRSSICGSDFEQWNKTVRVSVQFFAPYMYIKSMKTFFFKVQR